MNEHRETSSTAAQDATETPADTGAFRQIGTITFRECIARTHVGDVYRGYDRNGGQPVALKIGDPRRSELRLDTSILPQLAHPGIVRIRDAGTSDNGELVVVSDAPQGRVLTDAASNYDGQYRQVAHLIRELALTLDHMHSVGVTCGDLSPRNIHIGEDELPVISEVGMGLSTPASLRVAELTRDGADTAEARERKFKLDERADVFALGCVLYFLLTGDMPTDQPSALMSDPHAPLDDIAPIDIAAPEAPTELRAICAQALATDPVHRYLHAVNVVRDLEAYLYGKRGSPGVKVAFVAVGAALVALFGLWGTVGGGPARIIQAEVLAHRADAAPTDVTPLAAAERSLGMSDRFSVNVQLSKRGYVSVFYRDPAGEIVTLQRGGAAAEPQAQFALPAPRDAPQKWWHPPPPGGVGVLIIVSHAEPNLPENLVAGVIAGMDDPPRSYAALVLRGRHIANTAAADALPVQLESDARTRKNWDEYASQIIKLLDAPCDDVVVGLMYVMGV